MRLLFDVSIKLVIDYQAREWCKLPYPDHPRGCPNYGKKEGCPLLAPLVDNYFNLKRTHYFVVVPFDLSTHSLKMKEKHPSWSDRQARCVLYWQSTVNKQLREGCQRLAKEYGLTYNLYPEAMGVNVIKTCQSMGLPIEARPVDEVFKVAMLGYLKSEE